MDLFGWEAERAALDAVALAHVRQDEARRRATWPPHGLRKQREAELRQATHAALIAEAALAAIRAEVRS